MSLVFLSLSMRQGSTGYRSVQQGVPILLITLYMKFWQSTYSVSWGPGSGSGSNRDTRLKNPLSFQKSANDLEIRYIIGSNPSLIVLVGLIKWVFCSLSPASGEDEIECSALYQLLKQGRCPSPRWTVNIIFSDVIQTTLWQHRDFIKWVVLKMCNL